MSYELIIINFDLMQAIDFAFQSDIYFPFTRLSVRRRHSLPKRDIDS